MHIYIYIYIFEIIELKLKQTNFFFTQKCKNIYLILVLKINNKIIIILNKYIYQQLTKYL